MRLPTSVLSRVRGSVALVALVGCSSPAPAVAPLAPEPVVEVAVAPDPIAYDGAREAERLARLDEGESRATSARAQRIGESVALAHDARERAAMDTIEQALGGMQSAQIDPIWGSGVIGPGVGLSSQRLHAGCGRG